MKLECRVIGQEALWPQGGGLPKTPFLLWLLSSCFPEDFDLDLPRRKTLDLGTPSLCLKLLRRPCGASRWPCPVSPHPCAMAGWGSWGWDLLPVTNHIARDFQPTLSPASGAAAVTATTEDPDPGIGMGMGWQRGPHHLRLAWGAGLSCL
uniref:Uncharacterized protein LOC123616622 n=1 Tax=Camelus bactrianus TaxID=9837 RepID=A0A9W3HHG5_CAMBA|nr:uncharacterized protein LOC116148420 [Camelus dromedarius]XP_045372063.1 uncharacterized protein LOC123616622 [Camelus bactrianus]